MKILLRQLWWKGSSLVSLFEDEWFNFNFSSRDGANTCKKWLVSEWETVHRYFLQSWPFLMLKAILVKDVRKSSVKLINIKKNSFQSQLMMLKFEFLTKVSISPQFERSSIISNTNSNWKQKKMWFCRFFKKYSKEFRKFYKME